MASATEAGTLRNRHPSHPGMAPVRPKARRGCWLASKEPCAREVSLSRRRCLPALLLCQDTGVGAGSLPGRWWSPGRMAPSALLGPNLPERAPPLSRGTGPPWLRGAWAPPVALPLMPSFFALPGLAFSHCALATSHLGAALPWRAGGPCKTKRVRTVFTPEQLERLEKEFLKQQYMVGTERVGLAATLHLTETQVRPRPAPEPRLLLLLDGAALFQGGPPPAPLLFKPGQREGSCTPVPGGAASAWRGAAGPGEGHRQGLPCTGGGGKGPGRAAGTSPRSPSGLLHVQGLGRPSLPGLTARPPSLQVKVWFQNRRIKWRKQSLEQKAAKLSQFAGTQPVPAEQSGGRDSDQDGGQAPV